MGHVRTAQTLELLNELAGFGVQKTYEPNQIFISAGQVPKKLGIVQTGLFRYYYLTEKGKEFTKGFMPENSVINSYSAMISRAPSGFAIEALEESVVTEIQYEQWLAIRDTDSKWDKFLITFLEIGYMAKEKRERDLLLLDAETRYANFVEEFPEIDKRVNLNVIASYLGIQPESLSRIRKKRST